MRRRKPIPRMKPGGNQTRGEMNKASTDENERLLIFPYYSVPRIYSSFMKRDRERNRLRERLERIEKKETSMRSVD